MNFDWLDMFDFLKQPLPTLMTDPRFYGQAAHFFGGAFAIVTAGLFFSSMFWVMAIWLLFAASTATKEFYYDTRFEIPLQTTKGAILDFTSYQLGALLGLLLVVVKSFL
jgi:hypothetical protein